MENIVISDNSGLVYKGDMCFNRHTPEGVMNTLNKLYDMSPRKHVRIFYGDVRRPVRTDMRHMTSWAISDDACARIRSRYWCMTYVPAELRPYLYGHTDRQHREDNLRP